MIELISGEKYLYKNKVATFLRTQTDGKGTLYLVFEVDGKEKYWSATIKPIGCLTHSDVQLPRFNGVVK